MINKTKPILFFSISLIALLFWLSVSFLSVAHSEKENTDFLKNYVATDKVLRNASVTIAEERSESYWGMGLNGLQSPKQRLSGPRSKTDDAIGEVSRSMEIISDSKEATLKAYSTKSRMKRPSSAPFETPFCAI